MPFKGYLLYRKSSYRLFVMDHKSKTLRTLSNIMSLTIQHEGSKNKAMYQSVTPLRGEGTITSFQSQLYYLYIRSTECKVLL